MPCAGFLVRHGKASISFGCGGGLAGYLDAASRRHGSFHALDLLKGHFSRAIEKGERISQSREKGRERGLWQRRFWEHLLRDSDEFNKHVDYIHWNPVKHGWVTRVADWPHSSFHDYAARGIYPAYCGCDGKFDVCASE